MPASISLATKNVRGSIIVRIVPIKQSNAEIILKLGARSLPMNTSCFCMNSINPYIVVDKTFRAGGKTNYITQQKSEISNSQTPNPSFLPMKFQAQKLCNGDLKNPVLFKVYNREGETPVLLGIVESSIDACVE